MILNDFRGRRSEDGVLAILSYVFQKRRRSERRQYNYSVHFIRNKVRRPRKFSQTCEKLRRFEDGVLGKF